MWAIGSHKAKTAPAPARPVLDLSGPTLRRAFENLVESAEDTGGVERYVGALALKASLFEEVLGKGQVSELTEPEFYDLAAFITPVRRRIGAWLGRNGFAAMRGRLVALARTAGPILVPPINGSTRLSPAFPPTASTAGRAISPPRCCTSPRPTAIR